MGDKILSFLGIIVVIVFSLFLFLLLQMIRDPRLFAGQAIDPEILAYSLAYLIFAIPLTIILKKRGYKYYWAGLIPIFNFFAIINYLGQPSVYFFFLIIPIFNFFFFLYLLASFLKRLDKHPALVFLVILPVIGDLYWIYLAFSVEKIEMSPF